jgi:hypothetical protein
LEVPWAEFAAPAGDRDQRLVEPAELGHLLEQAGVTRDVQALFTGGNDVADRAASRSERQSTSVVRGRCGGDAHDADLTSDARLHRHDVGEAMAGKKRPVSPGTSTVRSRPRDRSERRSWCRWDMSTARVRQIED